jgi:hypothetical protein
LAPLKVTNLHSIRSGPVAQSWLFSNSGGCSFAELGYTLSMANKNAPKREVKKPKKKKTV